MDSYLKYENRKYNFPSDSQLSLGNACETKDSKMCDNTKTSYAITTYTKPKPSTYTLTINLTIREYPHIIEEIYRYENLIGKSVDFTYCNIPFGNVIISGISTSLSLDTTFGIVGALLTINMEDNVVITKKSQPKIDEIIFRNIGT